MEIAIFGVFVFVAIILPIGLLILRLRQGDQIEATSEGKQFFSRRRDRD
jgi:hypothetical protein